MIQYGTKIIADAGHYLYYNGRASLTLPIEAQDKVNEKEIAKATIKLTNNIYNVGGVFNMQIGDNVNTKAQLVGLIFTPDDQIAIMLNKNDNAQTKAIFKLMQDWRKYFSSKIKEVKNMDDAK